MVKIILYSIAVISATIIGAGFLALPYVTSKVGFWIVLGYFLVLGPLVILIHHFFCEVALRTPGLMRLPGYARYHLGKWAGRIALCSSLFSMWGALLSFLIIGGEFLKGLLGHFFGEEELIYTLIYFLPAAILILLGIRPIARVEFVGMILFFLIVITIYFQGRHLLGIENLFPQPNFTYLFLPYGVILFALWGVHPVPEVKEMLRGKRDLLKMVIPISVLIPILLYLFFIYVILGITGPQIGEGLVPALKATLGESGASLVFLLGILTTFTSFLTLGLTIKKIFWYDLKMNKTLAWAIACFIPLFLFLSGIIEFVQVVFFVGAVMLGIDGILISLMYKKINPEGKFIVYPLILIFFGGMVYALFYYLL